MYITTSFDYAGGTVNVELDRTTARVTFKRDGQTIEIENSSGEVADWHDLYQRQWLGLSGAALTAAEQKYARQHGENAIGEWIVFASERMAELAA